MLAVGSCVDGWPDSPIRSESRQGPNRGLRALKVDTNKINTKEKRNNNKILIITESRNDEITSRPSYAAHFSPTRWLFSHAYYMCLCAKVLCKQRHPNKTYHMVLLAITIDLRVQKPPACPDTQSVCCADAVPGRPGSHAFLPFQ